MKDLSFYQGKRVFVTGHTGFKGTWLCQMLVGAGAEVTGYALTPPTKPAVFQLTQIEKRMDSIIGDIREYSRLKQAMAAARPEIVLHLAAQPLVRAAYENPAATYETNVMGTVHILECVRQLGMVRSFLNVTTDKVYQNNEWARGYREEDVLDGRDPYSNSKSCAELITHSYQRSFLRAQGVAVSTARAGNVIGGGDFAADRIIPDCIRAASAGKVIGVRNPWSTRPFQHVLEPLYAYLMIAAVQYHDPSYAGCYNVGPEDADCLQTGDLVDLFCEIWQQGQRWEKQQTEGPHEANFLKLDCSRLKQRFGWKPRWNVRKAMEKTVEWTKVYFDRGDVCTCMNQQIDEFIKEQEQGL